jgi:DNA-binding transcriptional MerR regulator
MRYTCQVATELTIDELASTTGTTTRSIRSFQTMGLLAPPALRGRTGLYGIQHIERVRAVLRLQNEGFSLQSLAVLFAAHERGDTLDDVLGLPDRLNQVGAVSSAATDSDMTELYGFADLLEAHARRGRRPVRGRPLLSVVPSTLWDETEAS